jgi:hypothetical protein
LVVFSPEYQYFEADEFSRFVSDNAYTLLHEIKRAPLFVSTTCRASGYFHATLIQGITALAAAYLSNPMQCVAAYKQALEAYKSSQVVRGLRTLIYAKEP